jgi:cytochrome c nitrite reductase small subunit
MRRPRKSRWWLYLSIVILIILGVGIFVGFGPPGLYAKSESPEFCGSCHAVEPEYDAWRHSAHYRAKCVDCHLPNDCLARHLVWKGLDGAKDFFAFHLGLVPDTIRISDRGAAVVRENCLRCHSEAMARVNEDRRCWSCHRRMSHRTTGAVETWTP